MDISVSLTISTDINPTMAVQFGLFINDSILAIGSIFESKHSISASAFDQFVISNMIYTVGRTIQLRLNKDDRLSIRVFSVNANVNENILYRSPSVVVTKIAD